MEKRMIDPIDIIDFLLAGKSIVTFKSVKTGSHFTYKLTKKKFEDGRSLIFVSVLYGDNNDQYTYIGTIKPKGKQGGVFCHTRGSKVSQMAPSFITFAWCWKQLASLVLPEALEVWHEGRCGKCGRKLTTPESLACGLGPTCRGSI